MNARVVVLFLLATTFPAPANAKLDPEALGQVYDVLQRGARSGDHAARALAVGSLLRTGKPEARAIVTDALKDPVFEVRAAAVRALSAVGEPAYLATFYRDLGNPQLDMVRQLMPVFTVLPEKDAVALALRLMKDDKAPTRNDFMAAMARAPGPRLDALLKGLMTSKDAALRQGATNFVLTLRGKGALPALRLLVGSSDRAVQLKALEALAGIEAGVDVSFARKLLRSKDKDVAVRAAEVLARHGDGSGVKLLLPLLDSKDAAELLRGLDALAPVAGADAVAAVARFFKEPERMGADVVRRALEIRYRAKDPTLVQALRTLRRAENLPLQALAIYYLGLVERGRALPSLHEDLFHGDGGVRLAVAEALGRIGHRESIPHLKRALDNARDPKMRVAVVRALAAIKDKDVVPIVSFLVTDPDPEVRKWAIIALTRVQHRDAVTSLRIAVQQDRSEDTRAEAVKAIMLLDKNEGITAFRSSLGWLPPAKLADMAKALKGGMVPYLDMALTSSRREIWEAGLHLLTGFQADESRILTGSLERTRSADLKIAILTRLVQKGGASELPRILKLADGKDAAIRVAAIRLLGNLHDMGADPALRKLLFDPADGVRIGAAVALLDLHGGETGKRPRRGKRR